MSIYAANTMLTPQSDSVLSISGARSSLTHAESTSRMEKRIARIEESLDRLISVVQGDQARIVSSAQQTVNHPFQDRHTLSAQGSSSESAHTAPLATLAEWVREFEPGDLAGYEAPNTVSPASDDPPPSPVYSDYSYDCIPTGVLLREEMLRARNDGYLGVNEDHVRHITWERFEESSRDPNGERSNNKRSRLGRHTMIARNPMDVGLCSYAESQELLDLFFTHSHVYAPAYDVSRDTWERMTSECPFSTSAILYITKRIRDGGRSISTLQEALRDHAEKLCRHTLFSPISSFDALQAMIVMASWGETSWRPSSHALSMSLDMGLDKCLGKLCQLDFRKDPSSHRALVTGSRVWLQVYIMSNGSVVFHRRPGSVPKVDVKNANRLLEHPLSQKEDLRLVSFVELWALQDDLVPEDLSNLTMDALDLILRTYQVKEKNWFHRWLDLFAKNNIAEDDTMVTDLKVLDSILRLRYNSMLLRFVNTKQQAHRLPPHRRQFLLDALSAARELVAKLLHTDYIKFQYATHYTHLGLVMAVKLYIRLAKFFGDRLDLRQTAEDLKMAAQILDTFPGVTFTEDIRLAIARARRERIFPPELPSSAPLQSFPPRPNGLSNISSTTTGLDAQYEPESFGDGTTSVSQTQDPIWDFDTLFGDWAETGAGMDASSGSDMFNADWWSIPFQ